MNHGAQTLNALNARVGRSMPNPMWGLLVNNEAAASQRVYPHPSPPPQAGEGTHWRIAARLRQVPRVWCLLLALLAALWPHWLWMTQRLTDGSDEPWGVLALVTVLFLLVQQRKQIALPPRAHLLASAALTVSSTAATLFLPPLLSAAIGMLALGTYLSGALTHKNQQTQPRSKSPIPTMPLLTLLLLSLPVIASLQFYLGYPLRWLTAQLTAPALTIFGVDASPAGAALLWNGRTVLIDPPCAGIGMLWVGSYCAALLSYLNRARFQRTVLNGAVAAAIVFAANVGRNLALFFTESGAVSAPSWAHSVIGLAAFACAVLPIVWFTQLPLERKP